MLTIRKEQMAALSACLRERFFARTLERLSQLFPGDPRIHDEPAERALITDGIIRAAEYGIAGGREVTLFIFLLHEYGPGFEKQNDKRWMQAILADKSLDEPEKMDLIYQRLELIQRNSQTEMNP